MSQPNPRLEPLRCALCDQENAVVCAVCNDAAFCAKDCKAEGDHIHQLLCKKLDEWGWSTPRPTEDSYIGIYFPVDGTGPEFYWSKGRIKVLDNETTGRVEQIDLLDIDDDKATSGDTMFESHFASKKRLPVPLIFSVRDRRDLERSSVNLSILEMTRGDQRGVWFGPAVLWCYREHVSLADLTYFNDFVKTYGDDAGSLRRALRVGELAHVEGDRPELFKEVKEMVRIRKEARDARRSLANGTESEDGDSE